MDLGFLPTSSSPHHPISLITLMSSGPMNRKLYALCGKSSSVIGPTVFGSISRAFDGNQRVVVISVASFFLIGLLLL